MSQRVRGVVFDLGGVLVRICRSWSEACARAGVQYHERVASPEQIEARRAVRDAYETGRIGCDEFFRRVAATTGGLVSSGEFERVHRAWIIGEYEGVRDLIRSLRTAGLATGVLSNTNHAHWSDLRQGVVNLVDHPHASHLLGVAKPDREIYRAFEEAARLPAPGLVFFDDLPANIEGARAAGWDAVWIDHEGDTAAQMRSALRTRGVTLA